MTKNKGQRTKDQEPGQPHIALAGLCVQFGGQAVLRDIDLDIPRGQTLAIIGESGCGKTVLLKSIIGLIRPSKGKCSLEGRNLTAMNERGLTKERLRFGFLFQQAALFDSLTVAQNVAFPLRQHTSRPADEVEETVHRRLAQVGLSDSVLLKKPAHLSGGMRKRVGLARALAMNPEIILYDEPTTGLDPIMSDVINELILRTRQQDQVTSIVVTHDMHTVERVADRVVMLYPLTRLEAGEPQILFDGSPEDVLNSSDPRVTQFVRGEARERLVETSNEWRAVSSGW